MHYQLILINRTKRHDTYLVECVESQKLWKHIATRSVMAQYRKLDRLKIVIAKYARCDIRDIHHISNERLDGVWYTTWKVEQ